MVRCIFNGIRVFILCIFLSLFYKYPVYADCPQNVQPIKEGQVANCEGYLFSPGAESEAHKAKEIADLQRSENEILEQRLKLYMDTTSDLSKDIAKRDNNESYIRLFYFGLGVLVAGFAVRNSHP